MGSLIGHTINLIGQVTCMRNIIKGIILGYIMRQKNALWMLITAFFKYYINASKYSISFRMINILGRNEY